MPEKFLNKVILPIEKFVERLMRFRDETKEIRDKITMLDPNSFTDVINVRLKGLFDHQIAWEEIVLTTFIVFAEKFKKSMNGLSLCSLNNIYRIYTKTALFQSCDSERLSHDFFVFLNRVCKTDILTEPELSEWAKVNVEAYRTFELCVKLFDEDIKYHPEKKETYKYMSHPDLKSLLLKNSRLSDGMVCVGKLLIEKFLNINPFSIVNFKSRFEELKNIVRYIEKNKFNNEEINKIVDYINVKKINMDNIGSIKNTSIDYNKKITWIHLSDMHVGGKYFKWDAIHAINELENDIIQILKQNNLRPKLLFFTGDLAFGVKPDQGPKLLEKQFQEGYNILKRIARKAGVSSNNIYLVPGNHDVNRNMVSNDDKDFLDEITTEDAITDLINSCDAKWLSIMKRLRDYRMFLYDNVIHLHEKKRKTDFIDNNRLVYAVKKKINGINIGIGGFNTAWSCCRDKEKGKLHFASRWQFENLQNILNESTISIVLSHHPPNWFNALEDSKILSKIESTFMFYLHGHEHNDWVYKSDSGHSRISAAAIHEDSKKSMGYNIVTIDLNRVNGKIWLREYKDVASGGWEPLLIPGRTDKNGCVSLTNIKNWKTLNEKAP